MDHIDKHLATSAINDDYPLALKAALAIGKKTLNKYYEKTDQSDVYRIAMGINYSMINLRLWLRHLLIFLALHPQHKLEYFKNAGWEEAWIKTARQIVEDTYKKGYASRDIISSPNIEVPVSFSIF